MRLEGIQKFEKIDATGKEIPWT